MDLQVSTNEKGNTQPIICGLLVWKVGPVWEYFEECLSCVSPAVALSTDTLSVIRTGDWIIGRLFPPLRALCSIGRYELLAHTWMQNSLLIWLCPLWRGPGNELPMITLFRPTISAPVSINLSSLLLNTLSSDATHPHQPTWTLGGSVCFLPSN
ncbi:hypothetical protein VTK73DRAFT_4267 [Phialemonium thermophilum]|uniref:Uncharacterized protein n=1 Tax=Phialemonium thermophilum TaxID=223376 RepID=A0ABR3WUU3_9PEZI